MLRKLSILVIFIGFIGTKSFSSNSSFITPITLSEDTTSINLSYLFNSQIDSVSCEINYTLTPKNQILNIIPNDDSPILSVLTIWSEGKHHDILLKKVKNKKYSLHSILKRKVTRRFS